MIAKSYQESHLHKLQLDTQILNINDVLWRILLVYRGFI